jgi:hemoglobin
MQTTIYEEIGGAEKLRALVDRFYELMDTRAEFAGIRALHPPDLTGSADKLYEYLSGWTGGPPLYIAKRGHPRLRARHLPFPIATSERDQWVACMTEAMADVGLDESLRARLQTAFYKVADFMRNRHDAMHADHS